MKILHLVLYSDDPTSKHCYEEMRGLTRQFYKIYENNVKTMYYKYDDNIDKDICIHDDMILVKGQESFTPGIINKTLAVFEYIVNIGMLDEYDYVVRTNISMIVDFDELIKELEMNPIDFISGGETMTLNWNGGGITDSTWYGTQFVQGSNIIFTPEAIRFFASNQHLVRRDIIDDVTIGIFIREHKTDKYPPKKIRDGSFKIMTCLFTNTGQFNYTALMELVKQNNYIFYRNKCIFNGTMRNLDVIQMNALIHCINIKNESNGV